MTEESAQSTDQSHTDSTEPAPDSSISAIPVAQDGVAVSHGRSEDEMIPLWLAALVLVLLLAVMGVGGYIIGASLNDDGAPATPEEFEVDAWLQEIVANNPDDLDSVLQLGYAYQQAGMYEEAIAEYDRVLEVYEFDTAALYNKGVVLHRARARRGSRRGPLGGARVR